MRLAWFKTVRSRLLALLVGITLPIACLTAITAVTTYRTVIATIEASQMRAADDYAVRTRVWYEGVRRSLISGSAALIANGRATGECNSVGTSILQEVPGYVGVHIITRDGQSCVASLDPTLGAADMAGIAASLASKPAIGNGAGAGAERGKTRYGDVVVGGKHYLAVYVLGDGDQPMREALLLTDPGLLDRIFDLGESDAGLVVALVSGNGVVVSRGAEQQDATWLPRQGGVPQERWQAPSRAGETRLYVARIIADPDSYVIASFDGGPDRAARTQFLVLLLAPLLTLILLCVVYMRAIDRHCVRWLRGIEAAARARSTLTTARAMLAPDMPTDIRSVAEAFNTMVDEQDVRQRRLQTALDDNRFLVRELHHRVKNSLQVVQSYIGLTKRDYRGEARLALADAECRVHVLSAAYRFTLADGEMQPVRIDLFMDDVVTMISNLLRRRDQWISGVVETRASLSVDRVIPLGFLVVDVVSRALRSTPGVTIRIALSDIDEQTLEIEISADREIAHTAPPKLFAGLVAQIEAVEARPPEGSFLGAWRLGHVS